MPVLVQISSDILWTVSNSECDLWFVMSGCFSVNVVHKWSTLCKYNISFISFSASYTNITLRHTDDTQQCADSMSSMSQLHTSDKSIAGQEVMSRLGLTTHKRNDHRGMCDRRRAVGTVPGQHSGRLRLIINTGYCISSSFSTIKNINAAT